MTTAGGGIALLLADLHPLTHQGRMQPLLEAGFHDLAVWEASNFLAERVRDLASGALPGLPGRPNAIPAIHQLFEAPDRRGHPKMTFNRYRSENEVSEHGGTVEMIRGIIRGTRNPLSHTRRRNWSLVEATERLAMISTAHRELDRAVELSADGSADPSQV